MTEARPPVDRQRIGKISKARGKRFEKKLARVVGGHIHTGFDGDVLAYDAQRNLWMFEAKSRAKLKFNRNDELWSFLDQINRYATTDWAPGTRWALAMYGGRGAMFPHLSHSGVFYMVPDWLFYELTGLGAKD